MVVLRASVTGIGILLIGLFFGATTIESWPMFMFWIVSVSTIFGLLGLIIGLWSKSFEQLNMPVVFFLTPLSMVGGVFNTVAMLPHWLRWLAQGQSRFSISSTASAARWSGSMRHRRGWASVWTAAPASRSGRHRVADVCQGIWIAGVRGAVAEGHGP